ncbi:DNA repair protein RadA [Candidatus Woesebacteria bacterium]|nr:DNA repair protein RadA [Candidatus Woesebacteria bacterium]
MSFFICSNCGYGSATFIGKCPDCNEWNTLKQARGMDEKSKRKSDKTSAFATANFADISVNTKTKERLPTHIHEFDRVIGAGFVPGQVALLTGEPGIGKSTLLLQALQKVRALYISGEESASQIKHRAERLKVNLDTCTFSDTLQIEGIIAGIEAMDVKPEIVVIDSIQMLYSKIQEGTPGSVSQLRECALQLVRLAKEKHIAMILIGHVTKDGDVAGPKIVEHMVDTVLSFEGEKISHFRILRANKNRFGSTDEIGIFEMTSTGLAEVNNPLAFVSQGDGNEMNVPGRSIAGVMEGKRPLFFEVQSLASKTTLPMPRRVVNGIDYNRVLLILAVIKRHMGIHLEAYDVYVNVAGGVDIKSPAADLAVIASIISSVKDVALPVDSVFIGEVGLLGEVRKVAGLDKVSAEAKRIGLSKQFTPATTRNCKGLLSIFK